MRGSLVQAEVNVVTVTVTAARVPNFTLFKTNEQDLEEKMEGAAGATWRP